MNYAADVLTELKIRREELIDEKITYLASILRTSVKMNMKCADSKYKDEAMQEFIYYTYQAMNDADIEHKFIEHLIEFFTKGNVSRLDNESILEDILYLLVDLSDIEDERFEDQLSVEMEYDGLIEYNALTSTNIEAPEYVSKIDKERILTLYNKTVKEN